MTFPKKGTSRSLDEKFQVLDFLLAIGIKSDMVSFVSLFWATQSMEPANQSTFEISRTDFHWTKKSNCSYLFHQKWTNTMLINRPISHHSTPREKYETPEIYSEIIQLIAAVHDLTHNKLNQLVPQPTLLRRQRLSAIVTDLEFMSFSMDESVFAFWALPLNEIASLRTLPITWFLLGKMECRCVYLSSVDLKLTHSPGDNGVREKCQTAATLCPKTNVSTNSWRFAAGVKPRHLDRHNSLIWRKQMFPNFRWKQNVLGKQPKSAQNNT